MGNIQDIDDFCSFFTRISIGNIWSQLNNIISYDITLFLTTGSHYVSGSVRQQEEHYFFHSICLYVRTFLGAPHSEHILLSQSECSVSNIAHYWLDCPLMDCGQLNVELRDICNVRSFVLKTFEVKTHPLPISGRSEDQINPKLIISSAMAALEFNFLRAWAPKARRLTSKEAYPWLSSPYDWSNQLFCSLHSIWSNLSMWPYGQLWSNGHGDISPSLMVLLISLVHVTIISYFSWKAFCNNNNKK